MLEKFKRAGVVGLFIAAGTVLLQPQSLSAAEWRDHDGYHDRDRRDHDWDRRRDWRQQEWREHEWRERRDYDRWRDRPYVYFNYTPRPNYYYGSPYYYGNGYSDPYNCPRY